MTQTVSHNSRKIMRAAPSSGQVSWLFYAERLRGMKINILLKREVAIALRCLHLQLLHMLA